MLVKVHVIGPGFVVDEHRFAVGIGPVGQFAEELRSFGPFHLRGLQRPFSLCPFKGGYVFLFLDVSVYKGMTAENDADRFSRLFDSYFDKLQTSFAGNGPQYLL